MVTETPDCRLIAQSSGGADSVSAPKVTLWPTSVPSVMVGAAKTISKLPVVAASADAIAWFSCSSLLTSIVVADMVSPAKTQGRLAPDTIGELRFEYASVQQHTPDQIGLMSGSSRAIPRVMTTSASIR